MPGILTLLTLDGQATTLQPNDIIVWDKSGCVSLAREGTPLRINGSDDKFYLGITAKSEFLALAVLIAASHGLFIKNKEGYKSAERLAYAFVSPGI